MYAPVLRNGERMPIAQYNKDDENIDLSVFLQECRASFIHGDPNVYRTGEVVLTMDDLNRVFIATHGVKFYWNFFEDMYVDKQVAIYIENLMDYDTLRYNDKNAETLMYMYPKLSARARIECTQSFIDVLRYYRERMKLDLAKVMCQVVNPTPEFLEEFKTHSTIKNHELETSDTNDVLLAVTTQNLDMVSRHIEEYAKINKIVVTVQRTNNELLLTMPFDTFATVRPGDTVNFERGTIYVVNYAINGSILDYRSVKGEI